MTSQPEVPGAPAVYLYREEITDDHLHMWSKYVRLKVLNEKGKDYANVELEQFSGHDAGVKVTDIQGRTIHPDGKVIPFTGKPYEKLIEKSKGYKESAKVFTLPDVEVGSIIEYRYTLRYDDDEVIPPSWFIQSDLFTRKAHYVWRPTSEDVVTRDERGDQITSRIAWAPILPPSAEFKQSRTPGTGYQEGQLTIDLNVHDVPPAPEEEFMPPVQSFTYRVLFYFSPYSSLDEYWKNQGKGWSKTSDKFIGPGPKVGAAVQSLVAGASTDDEKLRKIYAAVMELENTTISGSHSVQDEKGKALPPPKNTDDIWERKRGGDDQITELFVAMARAAGMKAYLMAVTSRDKSLFYPRYLSFSQFNDYVAIVNVGGKERFFDPGQRFCPYGHLAWKHDGVQGIRQLDKDSKIDATSMESYQDSQVKRIADLKIDEHGQTTGTLQFTWTGSPALRWRQESLRGDVTGLNHDMEAAVQEMMPAGIEVKFAGVDHLQEYEQPLIAHFTVAGQMGSMTGKRLILPGDIFEANAKPAFTHDRREMPVYFEYPMTSLDAMRIIFPPTLTLESQPAATKLPLGQTAMYTTDAKTTPTSVTVYRNLLRAQIIYLPKEYPDLRAFYNKLETADQQPLILKVAAATTAQAGGN